MIRFLVFCAPGAFSPLLGLGAGYGLSADRPCNWELGDPRELKADGYVPDANAGSRTAASGRCLAAAEKPRPFIPSMGRTRFDGVYSLGSGQGAKTIRQSGWNLLSWNTPNVRVPPPRSRSDSRNGAK